MIIIKISIDDNRFLTLESKPSNLDLIEKEFTFQDMSNCWAMGRFHKERIKYIHFMARKKKNPTLALLPIGFLDDLKVWLEENNAKYRVIDNRKNKLIVPEYDVIENNLKYLKLYDYQVDSIKTSLECGNGLIKSPTGSGKTELFISICNLSKLKTLILFARIDLAHQTLKRMKKAGLDAGIVQGNNVDEDHQVVMCTVQSRHKLKQFNKYEMLIIDECHRAAADGYQEILRLSKARYRFGFSATPLVPKDKLKNARIKAWLGDVICEVSSKRLIDEQRIARPIVHIIPIDKPINISNSQWAAAEKWGIVNNVHRNEVIKRLADTLDGQILILVKKIDQGKLLEERIKNSHFLYGASKQEDRKDIVELFGDGSHFVLIASTIFDEGISIDNINHVIIAGGGSSYIKTLQRLGRGTRIVRDKNGKITKSHVDIYDFLDKENPILLKHSNSRIKIYENEGFDRIIYESDSWVKMLLE